jgi:hypothetical protein
MDNDIDKVPTQKFLNPEIFDLVNINMGSDCDRCDISKVIETMEALKLGPLCQSEPLQIKTFQEICYYIRTEIKVCLSSFLILKVNIGNEITHRHFPESM